MRVFRLHEYIDRRHKKLGPIFYEKLGGNTKLVFVSDPVVMKSLFLNHDGKYPTHLLPDPWVLYEKLYGSKRGLFFMNGEEWLSNRRVMNKHLLRDDVEKLIKTPVEESVAKFINSWKKGAKNGCFMPNLESEFYRFSTEGKNLTINNKREKKNCVLIIIVYPSIQLSFPFYWEIAHQKNQHDILICYWKCFLNL